MTLLDWFKQTVLGERVASFGPIKWLRSTRQWRSLREGPPPDLKNFFLVPHYESSPLYFKAEHVQKLIDALMPVHTSRFPAGYPLLDMIPLHANGEPFALWRIGSERLVNFILIYTALKDNGIPIRNEEKVLELVWRARPSVRKSAEETWTTSAYAKNKSATERADGAGL